MASAEERVELAVLGAVDERGNAGAGAGQDGAVLVLAVAEVDNRGLTCRDTQLDAVAESPDLVALIQVMPSVLIACTP